MQRTVVLAGCVALGTIGIGQIVVDATARDRHDRPQVMTTGAIDEEAIIAGDPLQGVAPDVKVWELSDIAQWNDGTYRAYSVGTTSCNHGNATLTWNGSNNQHPVIAQNMFRVHDGRIEQLGQSWLKHGFCALDLNACGSCQGTGCGSLGINCSDPYTAARNGSQSNAGPKYQINATTGIFPYPPADPSYSGNTARRLRVPIGDVSEANYPGARYFVEGQYVHFQDSPDDAGDSSNNASYREMNLGATGSFDGYIGNTVREVPGIYAWAAVEAGVTTQHLSVPGEGNVFLAYKVTDNGNGTWTYEYAVQNLDLHRSIGSFAIPVDDSTTLSNIGFHDVDYHSGEPWDGTDWSFSHSGGMATWNTTPHGSNPSANAIRWGTLYNFRFTADAGPVNATADLGIFMPGTPTELNTGVRGPDSANPLIAMNFPGGAPALVDPNGGTSFLVEVEEIQPGGLEPGSVMFHYRENDDSFTSIPMAAAGGDNWTVNLPATTCGSTVDYYFSAEDTDGGMRTLPVGAPLATYSSTSAAAIAVSFEDDMETNPGWTVQNVAITGGAWERGVPAGNGDRGDPLSDGDGSGAAWLTENAPDNTDVDGGPTQLSSPMLDASGAGSATVTYRWWFTNDDQDVDRLDVEISDDNGATWTLVNSHADTAGWQTSTFTVEDYVGLTDQLRLRFSATDNPNDSVTEAGVDGVVLSLIECGDDEPCVGDLDDSGDVGFNDLVAILSAWGPCAACPEDLDDSGDVGFNDIVTVLSAWGACP